MLYELICSECNISFASASSLLQHFAHHANVEIAKDETAHSTNNDRRVDVPDLYPISTFKSRLKHCLNDHEAPSVKVEDNEKQDEDGGLRFCAITVDDLTNDFEQNTPIELITNHMEFMSDKMKSTSTLRKYKCTYCLKTFGWSTDLKRHILTHTGERPFKCQYCDSTFTRKFLLQKHQIKQHNIEYITDSSVPDNINVPSLKPINFFKQKSRKQDKEKIKRKVLNTKNVCQIINDQPSLSKSLLCST